MSESRPDFFRVSVQIWGNVRMRRAAQRLGQFGVDAFAVYCALLASNRMRGQSGTIDPPHSDLDAWGYELAGIGVPEARAVAALEALCAVGLVERLPSSGLRIIGWSDFWRTGRDDATRKADSRSGRRDQVAPPSETCHTPPRDSVTPPPVTQSRPPGLPPVHPSPVPAMPVQAMPGPSSPTPPRKDGPIESTPKPDPQQPEEEPAASPLDAELRALGIASSKHRAKAARHLSEFHDPAPVLRIVLAHCRRYGDGPGLLATILGDRQQIALVLREAEAKADTEDARKAAQDLLARLKLRTLAATAGAAR